jgi:adenylate kinase
MSEIVEHIKKLIGEPRNYGPTPEELEEIQRQEEEKRIKREEEERAEREQREAEEAADRKARQDEWVLEQFLFTYSLHHFILSLRLHGWKK